MLNSGVDSTVAMSKALTRHGNHVAFFIVWFSFFALITSFLGVGLGIFDFFSDGLQIHKTKLGRIVLSLLTIGPPFLFAIIYPQGFLIALSYAGIFAAILLIIYPIAMAWSARYVAKVPGVYQMFGGKLILLLTLVFGLLVMFADVFERLGIFPVPNP
jgi:tyrosine-specific transport protein